jgi:protein O-GlcNAc transferase
MDYFLSSELLDSPAAAEHYTEKLIRMPLTGTCYERPATPPERISKQSIAGVSTGNNLYACPQSLFKFHPDFDVILRRILEGDPAAVIVGTEGRVPEWTARLRNRWKRTIPEADERILLLPTMPNDAFLNLLSASDVVLDPVHFGGGNSSYEALACGTPIVTLPGEFLRSRITAALYRRMGLESLVATSADDYVNRAVAWAGDHSQNESIRRQIRERADVLFENPDEVRCLEDTLQRLWAEGAN